MRVLSKDRRNLHHRSPIQHSGRSTCNNSPPPSRIVTHHYNACAHFGAWLARYSDRLFVHWNAEKEWARSAHDKMPFQLIQRSFRLEVQGMILSLNHRKLNIHCLKPPNLNRLLFKQLITLILTSLPHVRKFKHCTTQSADCYRKGNLPCAWRQYNYKTSEFI